VGQRLRRRRGRTRPSDLGGDQLVDAQDQDLVFLAKSPSTTPAVRSCGTAPSAEITRWTVPARASPSTPLPRAPVLVIDAARERRDRPVRAGRQRAPSPRRARTLGERLALARRPARPPTPPTKISASIAASGSPCGTRRPRPIDPRPIIARQLEAAGTGGERPPCGSYWPTSPRSPTTARATARRSKCSPELSPRAITAARSAPRAPAPRRVRAQRAEGRAAARSSRAPCAMTRRSAMACVVDCVADDGGATSADRLVGREGCAGG
jgi:hypothetical protein